MIRRHHKGQWEGIELTHYKNEPGTWVDVSRQVLFGSDQSQFETRVFTVAPGGYSSFEKHEHEHCVLVLSGTGEVKLDDSWHSISALDLIHVQPWQPHQFRSQEDVGLTILCIVDRNRDRPVLLGNEEAVQSSLS